MSASATRRRRGASRSTTTASRGSGSTATRTTACTSSTRSAYSVHDNFIFDNSGYGIHLWTHSISGRFYNNTIDGNGSGSVLIGGQWNSYGGPSSNNAFYANILSYPGSGKNVVSFWSASGSPGSGNVVSRNCVWQGSLVEAAGVSYADNVAADPAYVDRRAKVYRLAPRSRCAAYGVRVAGAAVKAGSPTP